MRRERWRVNRQGFKRNGWTEFAVFAIMVAATILGYALLQHVLHLVDLRG